MLGFEEIFRKIDETIAVGGNQLLLQGGHNPDLPIAVVRGSVPRGEVALSRVQAARAVAARSPAHLAAQSDSDAAQVIERLVAAGLDSIPGGGAEILVDRVRKLLNCYGKASSDEWLDVMREAHQAGLRTTATMMYGTVETDEERIEHMMRLRDLQDETGGFTAFITWSYQPEHTEHGGVRGDRRRLPPHAGARRASCSTTSTTCRRRGSRRAARSGSSAWPSAPTTWAA